MKKYLLISFILLLTCLTGCKNKNDEVVKKNEEEPVCGGVTNNTDYNAPKVINSDKLVKFSVGFYHEDKFDSSSGRYYIFVLEPDTDGKIILKDSYNGDGFEVSEPVLDGTQEIIKKYDLAKANGVNKITAGLPPEFEECDFYAEYDNGECIRFAENSDPSSEWGREFIDYFADVFAEHGDNQYLTPKISGVIKCFNLEIQRNNILYQYRTCSDNKISRDIYDFNDERALDETYVESSSEYYDGILQIVSDMEIRDFENYDSSSDFINDGMTPPYYDFYIEFEDGNIMSGASCDPEVLEKFMPMGEELMSYIDSYLDANAIAKNAHFEGYMEVPVWTSYASSHLYDDDYDRYNTINLYDNDPETAYVEGVNGDGIGEMVMFEFGEGFEASCYAISKIEIRPGYQKSHEAFENNSRPLKLGFYFLNGRVEYAEFNKDYDENTVFTLEFDPVIAKDCVMVIEDAVSGKKYKDLCISEVKFYSQYTDDMIFYEHNVYYDDPESHPSWDINIEAYKGDEMVWSHMTHNPLTELSGKSILTCGFGKVIVYDEQSIVALDALTGETLWVNEDCGYPGAYSFDSNGNLYICSYLGSNLCVIDKDGNTIQKKENYAGEDYNWGSMLVLHPDGILNIYYASYGEGNEEGKIFTARYN